MLASVSRRYPEPKGRFPRVTHPCATKAEAFVRLACVRHAASVRSEPGSNSQVQDGRPFFAEQAHLIRTAQSVRNPSFRNCIVSYCLTRMLQAIPRFADPQPVTSPRTTTAHTAACASLLTTLYPLIQEPRDPKTAAAPAPNPRRAARRGRCI